MTNRTHPDTPTEAVTAWRHSATGQTYALTADAYRCLVWQTTTGTWGAVVNGDGTSTAAYTFATPEDAKTWCEAHMLAQVDPSASAAAETAASTRPAAPQWRYRAVDGNYTLGYSGVHCRVWRTAADTWRAVVTQPQPAKRTQQTFDTLEDAQAWCEEQIAQRLAGS